jgi:hypothetical protein
LEITALCPGGEIDEEDESEVEGAGGDEEETVGCGESGVGDAEEVVEGQERWSR